MDIDSSYIEKQNEVLLALNNKILKLEMEKRALEHKLTEMTANAPTINSLDIFDITDEETVCLTQIALLRGLALQRELSTEETKRFEVYHKAMNNLRGRKKEEEKVDLKDIDNDNLLQILDGTIVKKTE
jgi:hypothetical protein